MELFAIALLIVGLGVVSAARKHLHEAKLLRLREIAHKERIVAMEQNLPLTDSVSDTIDVILRDGRKAGSSTDRVTVSRIQWIRLIAQLLGIIGIFGGVGLMGALQFQADGDASGMAPIGLIPAFIGIGLLLFVRLSRNITDNESGQMIESTDAQ